MDGNSGNRVQEHGDSHKLLPFYKHFLEGVYMTFHFGRNEKFSVSCLVNLFILFRCITPKRSSLFRCGHFDEISFRVIKCYTM